jgi:hypothetical protein
LLAPLGDWQRWWTMRFADLAGAEAWIEAEVIPPASTRQRRSFHLARRWAREIRNRY